MRLYRRMRLMSRSRPYDHIEVASTCPQWLFQAVWNSISTNCCLLSTAKQSNRVAKLYIGGVHDASVWASLLFLGRSCPNCNLPSKPNGNNCVNTLSAVVWRETQPRACQSGWLCYLGTRIWQEVGQEGTEAKIHWVHRDCRKLQCGMRNVLHDVIFNENDFKNEFSTSGPETVEGTKDVQFTLNCPQEEDFLMIVNPMWAYPEDPTELGHVFAMVMMSMLVMLHFKPTRLKSSLHLKKL